MTFLESLPPDGAARDAFLGSCIAADMLDPPTWVLVQIGRVDLEVSADYLTILGEHVPMAAHVAQAAADRLGGILPTPAIVDAIERDAVIVPAPTWSPPPGQNRSAQTSGAIFAWCEEETRRRFAAAGVVPGRLVAGHRKDVVFAGHMLAGHVTIYGGRWPDGRRIQGVSAIHEGTYEDYSHGVRVVAERCWLDGEETTVTALLSDPRTAPLLGGPVAALRYDTLATAPTDRPAAPDGRPTDPAPRVLRRGDRGDDVAELQRLLTAAGWYTRSDGVFGPLTEAAVRAFQYDTGLTQDGLAGVRTLAALRAYRPADAIPFVQARNFRTGRLRPVRAVVLHTAETSEAPDVAEKLAAWAAGPEAPMASWHYAVDADSIVQCVREEDTAFAAPGLNADGVQVEMSGRAAQDAAGWSDAYSRAVLARAARLVADVCRRHALPVAFVDAAGLLRGERGITTHAEVTKAYRQSTHTDPGKDFDMGAFLAAVRAS